MNAQTQMIGAISNANSGSDMGQMHPTLQHIPVCGMPLARTLRLWLARAQIQMCMRGPHIAIAA